MPHPYNRPQARDFFLTLLGLWGCSAPEPVNVYVPAPDYRQSLTITADLDPSGSLRAGSWLVLHARRSTGPWQVVQRSEADLTDCWWRRPPPPEEDEVADNVAWKVLPADSILFNLPTPPVAERRLRLAHPGRYQLWAISHGCHTPIVSDTIIIEVVP